MISTEFGMAIDLSDDQAEKASSIRRTLQFRSNTTLEREVQE
jgi:hypothetical protein